MTLSISTDTLNTLKQQGVDRHDPAMFSGIESRVKRAAKQRDNVRNKVLNNAQRELDRYLQRHSEHKPADETVTDSREEKMDGARATSIGDLVALRQHLDKLTAAGEGDTVSHLSETAFRQSSPVSANCESVAPSLPALRSSLVYRQLQHRQYVDQFMDTALHATPESPGPLNPEILAIRLLSQINDLSPSYISHYVSYFETLQWLHNNKVAAPSK